MSFTISLSKIIDKLSLKAVYMPKKPEEIFISSMNVGKPGIELAGFLDYFDNSRVLIIGNTENAFLEQFPSEDRYRRVKNIFDFNPPAVIITRNMQPHEEMISAAKDCQIPLLISEDKTNEVISSLVSYLSFELAPRMTRHAAFVEVYGEGVLLVGSSGIGKSETAVQLIKRGHRLIADDAVEIRKVEKDKLIGSSPENVRHFVEVRGVGIINARRIFGMGAVKLSETINLVVSLELWDDTKFYDRLGIDNDYTEMLGVKVPIVTVPVKPGRNLAVIIEIAAMNNRQKKMGFNAARELMARVGMKTNHKEVSNKREIEW